MLITELPLIEINFGAFASADWQGEEKRAQVTAQWRPHGRSLASYKTAVAILPAAEEERKEKRK